MKKLSLNYILFAGGMLQFTVGFIVLETFFMGESFQDYSGIQDFEADFPKKVSFKMLN